MLSDNKHISTLENIYPLDSNKLIHNESIYNKKTIRVLVIMGSENSYYNANIEETIDGKKILSGFNWDIWKKIQDNLSDRYNFEIFLSPVIKNYDLFVNEIEKGNYDIAISGFTQLSNRLNVNFTIPHVIDSTAVVYKYEPLLFKDFTDIFITLIEMLLYLIIIGSILGICLYLFDPSRRLFNKKLQNSNKLFFFRSLLTGISSAMGETGNLSERASLSITGIVVSVIATCICFILVMFFQGEITKIMITNENNKINHYNVRKYRLLGHKNNSDILKLKKYGATVTMKDNMSTEELLKVYLDNNHLYDGVIMRYHEAFFYTNKYKKLTYSSDFGNDPSSFIINKNLDTFLYDVNKEIVYLKETRQIQKICISYFGDIENIPMCSVI